MGCSNVNLISCVKFEQILRHLIFRPYLLWRPKLITRALVQILHVTFPTQNSKQWHSTFLHTSNEILNKSFVIIFNTFLHLVLDMPHIRVEDLSPAASSSNRCPVMKIVMQKMKRRKVIKRLITLRRKNLSKLITRPTHKKGL